LSYNNTKMARRFRKPFFQFF